MSRLISIKAQKVVKIVSLFLKDQNKLFKGLFVLTSTTVLLSSRTKEAEDQKLLTSYLKNPPQNMF